MWVLNWFRVGRDGVGRGTGWVVDVGGGGGERRTSSLTRSLPLPMTSNDANDKMFCGYL